MTHPMWVFGLFSSISSTWYQSVNDQRHLFVLYPLSLCNLSSNTLSSFLPLCTETRCLTQISLCFRFSRPTTQQIQTPSLTQQPNKFKPILSPNNPTNSNPFSCPTAPQIQTNILPKDQPCPLLLLQLLLHPLPFPSHLIFPTSSTPLWIKTPIYVGNHNLKTSLSFMISRTLFLRTAFLHPPSFLMEPSIHNTLKTSLFSIGSEPHPLLLYKYCSFLVPLPVKLGLS
jgi:hypothetical protein